MDLQRVDGILAGERPGSGRLNELEVYGLLAAAGLECSPAVAWLRTEGEAGRETWHAAAADLADAEGRLLLKVLGRDILHKTEVGGVKLIRAGGGGVSPAMVAAEADRLLADLEASGVGDAVEGLLATAFVPHEANRPGQEVLLSVRQDPAFGPCVVVGVGGTLTEWYGRAARGPESPGSTLVLPARGLTAEQVVAAVTAHPMLALVCTPSRLYAEPPVAAGRLAEAVLALAALGIHAAADGAAPATLEELEINPAVASAGSLVALDGVATISDRRLVAPVRSRERIGSLLAPRSAVILGVSAKGTNPGRIILENLRKSDGIDPGRLWVLHHRETAISGVPCVEKLADLPEKVDLAVVSVPAEGALAAITEIVAGDRARSIILIPGGFAEAGEADLAKRIEDVLAAGHRRPGGGPVMVGGNCLGIVSRDRYNTFFLPDYKLAFRPARGGNLAVVSQSGAYLVTFASNYDGVIQPRASISFGNQMDLTVADFLEHFNEIPEVDVIACYIEGFRAGDGDRFLAACRAARSRGKRVVVFKAGKTALGAQAAASHTASLAGDYAVARACLVGAGAVVAETLDEFEDLIKTFTLLAGREPAGVRTGIISNAGFECSTVMDRLEGLELAVFDPETQAKIDAVLPGFAHRTNPIDCTPMTATEAFCTSCAAILASPAVDAAILSSVPVTPALNNLPADPDGRHREDMEAPGSQPRLMVDIIAGSAKPAVVVVDSGRIYDPMCRLIEREGIPVFRKIDRAARALAAFCRS